MKVRRDRRHVSRAIFCIMAATAGVAGTPTRARAGGFFVPDLGAEGLARGGAFTAKADDGLALVYNVAGLARQRGTRLTLNFNVPFNSFVFTRKGTFPDEETDETPWGQKPFPSVRNTGGAGVLPFLAVSTDLGFLDRVTLAAGLFPPSAIPNRTFPLGVEKAPAASRYDSIQSKGILIYPTIAGAFRILPWLDAGVAAHLVYATFDQTTLSYADSAAGQCKSVEDYRCDARSNIVAKGMGFTGSLGLMARPTPALQFGLNFMGPSTVTASGSASAKPPPVTPNLMIKDGTAELEVKFPWVLRAGGRYVNLDGKFELWDLELDVTYEAWQPAQTPGPTATITGLGMYETINGKSEHYYKNTFSLRGGGAYNMEEFDGIVSLRGGAFYDSTASESAYTRLDFDTLAKIAGTLGVGYKRGGVKLDLGYAAIASVPRRVDDGRVKPVNGTKEGKPVDAAGNPLPAVNNGDYSGFTHVITFGVGLTFDAFFGSGERKPSYGDPAYEDVAGAKPVEKKDEDDKKEEKKDEPPPDAPKKPDVPTENPKNPTQPGTGTQCKWGEC